MVNSMDTCWTHRLPVSAAVYYAGGEFVLVLISSTFYCAPGRNAHVDFRRSFPICPAASCAKREYGSALRNRVLAIDGAQRDCRGGEHGRKTDFNGLFSRYTGRTTSRFDSANVFARVERNSPFNSPEHSERALQLVNG